MATERWVTIDSKWCELVEMDVSLEEKREYPTGSDQDLGHYIVTATRCSANIVCNMAGVPCSGAYTNPGVDRFNLEE